MSETTGDPVLDQLEALFNVGTEAGLLLQMPTNINHCSDDVLRALLWNTREAVREAIRARGSMRVSVPETVASIRRFLAGGPRPEIIG